MADKLAYRGPDWPLHIADWAEVYGGPFKNLWLHHDDLRQDLRAQFERKAEAIRNSTRLTESAKQDDLRALAMEFRQHKTLRQYEADLAALRTRAAKLHEELIQPPKDDNDKLSAYAAGRLLRKEDRLIAKFESLDQIAQQKEVMRLRQNHDLGALRTLMSADLVNEQELPRVRQLLMENASPEKYREWQHITGPVGRDGVTRAFESALHVCGLTRDLFLRFIDEECGLGVGEGEAAAAVRAATKDGRIELTAAQLGGEDGYRLYEAADAAARASGREFVVTGDDGRHVVVAGNGSASGEGKS